MQLLSNVPSSELFTHNVTDYIYSSTEYSEPNALSLEASIQKSVEEELYSSLEVHSPCDKHKLKVVFDLFSETDVSHEVMVLQTPYLH
jgi:spatacsin